MLHRDRDYRPPREYRRDQTKYAVIALILLAIAAWFIFAAGERVLNLAR